MIQKDCGVIVVLLNKLSTITFYEFIAPSSGNLRNRNLKYFLNLHVLYFTIAFRIRL